MHEFLRKHTLRREEIDTFLDESSPNWARYDSELGYLLRDNVVRDGIDGSLTITTLGEDGHRRMVNYPERECRMNAYGNSYTQCQQVSDGETWEEYLAGHLGEPVRNFGVGGYGVYQAYRRLRRVEETGPGVEYVILNIFGSDDHLRSIDAWRRPRCGDWFETRPFMFHANPWDHVRMDLDTGRWVEKKNPCPTPESLYNLCDPDWVYATFKEDIALNMSVAQTPGAEVDWDLLSATAEGLGIDAAFDDPTTRPAAARTLHMAYGLRATLWILDRIREFVDRQGKKLLVILSFGQPEIMAMCEGRTRGDGIVLDYLKRNGVRHVDSLAKHAADYACFRLSPADYVRRYCIPHYNPAGNHFLAYAVKNEVVDWLDPKPFPYREEGETMGFGGYLPGP